VPAESGSRTPSGRSAGRSGFELFQHIDAFLANAPPVTLLIAGEPGAGKSTFLRTLIPRLQGPSVYLAYKAESITGHRADGTRHPEARDSSPPTGMVSMLLVDPEGQPDPSSADPNSAAPGLMAYAPAAVKGPEEAVPPALVAAVGRLAAKGEGFIIVDSWDSSSEKEFRALAGDHGLIQTVTAPSQLLRADWGQTPARVVFAIGTNPDSEMLSQSDGLLHLDWEDVEGYRLRVLSILKLRHTATPESRYLYTLEGGRFYCPPQFPHGFRPPIGPPDADPEPQDDSLFSGSVDFHDAFGRLRYHGLTGVQVPPRFPSTFGDVFLYPLITHTIAQGGRVVWIPSASNGPAQIAGQLSKWIPPDFLRERLRVITPLGVEAGLGDLKPIAIPVRRVPPEARAEGPAASTPIFQDAYKFLQGTPEGKPCLYALYLDGLHALANIAGVSLSPDTFPVVVQSYVRLPRMHGFGFGRSDDPLIGPLLQNLDIHIQIEEKYGRTVLFGRRPRTHPYLLDWTDGTGRYALVPIQ
jgi:hypothetical protein